MRRTLMRGTTAALMLTLLGAASAQQPDRERKVVTIRDQQLHVVRGNAQDLPAGFLDKLLCEGGAQARDPRTACLRLNADGTGEWEHDAAPGRRPAPARVTWWLVTDAEGTVTRVGNAERDTYYLVFEFLDEYWSYKPGDLMRETATLLRGTRTRVLVHSKYRDL